MGISAAAAQLLAGTTIGNVYPAATPVPLEDIDARTASVRRLRQFFAALDFSRIGAKGAAPIGFRIPESAIFEEQPDDEAKIVFPSLGMLPSPGVHDAPFLGPAQPDESTIDVFAPRTVLYWLGEYTETITIEVWGSHKGDRRALMAGLKQALRSQEDTIGLRLTLPEYYDRICQFNLPASQYIDDPDVVRGRRRGQLSLELRCPEVVLVDYVTMRLYVTSEIVNDL
jgi:hypothetical protein